VHSPLRVATTAESTAAILDAPETRAYLESTVRAWLGVPWPVEVPELPPALARTLLRLPEHEREERDRWRRWDYQLTERHERRDPWDASIDEWFAEQHARLPSTTPLWPDGHRFAVCLTHDIDLLSTTYTPAQLLRYARNGFDADGSRLARFVRPPLRLVRSLGAGIARAPSARETLERSAALLADRGLTASYLFTVPGPSRFDCVYAPEDACTFRGVRRRIADVARTLAEEGFDVGLHGSYGAGVRTGALTAERARLRAATGLPITSSRQHLLHWDVRWTPHLQQDAGLLVDSSLGFSRNVGFRGATSLPFRWFDAPRRRRLELLEVPVVLHDVGLLGAWGLGLGLARACEVVAEFLDRAARLGTLCTVVFHPDKLAHGDWLSLYRATLDECAARGAWVTSLTGLADWWRERESRVLP
jgi:hypothetical protein